ncbi:DUF2625 family protein [Nocardia uniformis]|uniref:DUF2625 family protein n=1 Tax=Nocardia uniformis TaxID=53432 RepID=A0A849CGA0_9NOCA|nr:DUF2625 family protein [Nocardia uniformis]NNH74719.1 DUF2625 family protein [Nocardia uniformis]
MKVRLFHELAEVDDKAWPDLQDDIATATVSVDILPVEPARARQTLVHLQVTARSTLGALVLHTGGVMIDHGWLRLLGGGHVELPDVATMSQVGDPGADAPPPFLIVAIDVLGGQFAINGGGLPADLGDVCFLESGSPQWESTGIGHSGFVMWVLNGGLDDFYSDRRWPGWATEVQALSPAQGLSIYPPIWSSEGGSDIAAASRSVCPLTELTDLHRDVAIQTYGKSHATPTTSKRPRFWRRR